MATAAVLVAGGIVVGMGGAFAATNGSDSSDNQSSSATSTSKKSNNKGKTKQAQKKDNNKNGQDDQGDKEDPDKAQPPKNNDFIDINKVKPNRQKQQNAGKNGSTGTFVSDCGNAPNHQNSDNVIAAPGVQNGAQHTHDYVGNDSTDANSDDDSLAAAGTSCKNQDDKSTYYWPVLRDLNKQDNQDVNKDGGGKDGNLGKKLVANSAKLEFVGNPKSQVNAMPQGLRILEGNAKAVTQNGDNAKKSWTCTGFEDRITDKYPICPQGSQVERIHEFPNCWDGQNTDSDDHRSHIVDANDDGSCQKGFEAVPQLRVTLTYTVPQNNNFAVDGFPEELHKPQTDHDDFINFMSDKLMNQVVDCINNGQNCVNQGQ